MRTTALMVGAGIGAGAMYVLDPERGRRRRALARDKMTHLLAKGDDAVGATARDLANRARGLAAELRSLGRPAEPVPDAVIEERVRSRLGQYCSHPSAIEVTASDGQVLLRGPILESEAERVLAAVRRTRGVRDVHSQLERHAEPGDVSALQGGVERTGPRWGMMQERWSPATRLVVGTAGLALLAASIARRGVMGAVFGTLGASALARAAVNVDIGRLAEPIRSGASRFARDSAQTADDQPRENLH